MSLLSEVCWGAQESIIITITFIFIIIIIIIITSSSSSNNNNKDDNNVARGVFEREVAKHAAQDGGQGLRHVGGVKLVVIGYLATFLLCLRLHVFMLTRLYRAPRDFLFDLFILLFRYLDCFVCCNIMLFRLLYYYVR